MSEDRIAMTEANFNEALAQVWDAAVASLRYEDGTPVEVAVNTNPYRSAA